MSFYKDVLDNVFHKDSAVLRRSVLNLESLWEALYSNFYSLYETVAKIGNLMSARMDGNMERRYPGRTFAQRSQELLQEIAPSTNRGNLNENERYKRQQSILNRQKRKRERSIKRDRYTLEREWRETFYKDLELQLKFKHIEYVDVDTADVLNPVSQTYIDELKEEHRRSRSRKVRDEQSDDYDYNHFLMYESLTATPHVIDEDWFTNTDDVNNTSTRVITEFTVERSVDDPNRTHALSKQDFRLIKAHVASIKKSNQIVRIKRNDIRTKDQDEEVIQFDGHISTSKFSFIGYDVNHRPHQISQDWVELNFKSKFPQVFKQIMSLQAGESTHIEPGSSVNSSQATSPKNLRRSEINLIGPKIEFIQKNKPSCLACSIASVLSYIDRNDVAQRVMEYYDKFQNENNNRVFNIKDILQVTFHNHGRNKHEKRWRCQVKKLKEKNAMNLLQDVSRNSFYHCVLANYHAVVLYDKWIFDATLPKALPRDEKHLRYTAQSSALEDTKSIVLFGYQYTW